MSKYLKHPGVIGCAVLAIFVRQPFAPAQSSTNYTVQNDVMDTGGSFSSSSNYQVIDAIGQPDPIGTSASPGYIESSGFLAGGRAIINAVEEPFLERIPTYFLLSHNYPNPFNPETTIEFQIPEPAEVVIQVFNIQGIIVKTLVHGKINAGFHSTVWDGRDDHGQNTSSGLYLSRMTAISSKQRFIQTRKLNFVR